MRDNEIKLKILDKNSRIFKSKYQDFLVSKGYGNVSKGKGGKANNVLMEGYLGEVISGRDFGDEIAKYWPGITGGDEQGIDFIFIQENTLFIINSKNGSGGYSNIDLEKILKGLKTCYGESNTGNKILENFISDSDLSNITNIKIYYFCRNGNKNISEPAILRAKEQIKTYSKPKECSGKIFKGTEIFFINYEDIYLNERKIQISVPVNEKYLFSDEQDTIFIARVPCSSIKEIVKKYGKSIFEKNIREEVGGKINTEIKESLEKEPENMFIFNNGITIVGDSVIRNPKNTQIDVFNAQIINGQQSSWTIQSIENLSTKAYILCRFIEINDSKKVRKITKTTNSQTPIDFRDFVSNDEIQEAIGEYFFEKNILYERKKSKKRVGGFKGKISNIELAQSTLAIILGYPSKITTPKKEILFTDNLLDDGITPKGFYSKIFSQDFEIMHEVYIEKYLICKAHIKKGGNELKNKGWLHIATVWYRQGCKDYDEAFQIFKKFADQYGIETQIKSGKNPLNRNQTDTDLEIFLKTYKK